MDRRQQIDLFVADILDVSPKGDLNTMENPVFALSTKPDLQVWRYENGDTYVEVAPSQYGRPTIFDKDLLMYCISQVVEGMNRGRTISQRVQIVAHDYLRATGRGTGGKDYEAMLSAIQRLRGVTITTNIGRKTRRAEVRGLIESATVIESDGRNRMISIEMVLSDWIFEAITTKRILTYSPKYYMLRKANERRLYELCRKHCGSQAIWQCGEAKLYEKFGTRSNPREFRRTLKELTAVTQNIPDYTVEYDPETHMFTAMYTPNGKALL